MSKTISISDEVYRKLKLEKGDKSFSEVIMEKINSGGNLKEVSGAETLKEDTMKAVKKNVHKGSRKTETRVRNETT